MTSKIPSSKEAERRRSSAALRSECLQLDTDGDGKVSIKELEKMLWTMKRKLSVTEDDIKETLRNIDVNGDGIIDLKEYFINSRNEVGGKLIHRALIQRSRIRREFASYDIDNSGYITKDEFIQVIRKRGMSITPDRIDQLIKEYDVDGNGKIDYEEFVMILTK